MAKVRDWRQFREMWIRALEKQTGEGVEWWMQRIRKERLADEQSLRAWLTAQGVTGYAQTLLVMEQFGYPDHLLATADELVEGQYADRSHLRPIYDAIIEAATGLGDVVIQTRKTYVSLVSPRRTFARVQPTTKNRVDLALRLEGVEPGGRLQPSKIHETTKLQISFRSRDEVDAEALEWLEKAYLQNS
jgi:hypothetical protein